MAGRLFRRIPQTERSLEEPRCELSVNKNWLSRTEEGSRNDSVRRNWRNSCWYCARLSKSWYCKAVEVPNMGGLQRARSVEE